MVDLKTPAELDLMRQAGKVVAAMLAAAKEAAAPGVSLRELDNVVAEVMSAAGGKSSFLHYHPHSAPTPFPAVICASVNDMVVHGIPGDYRLKEGDLLSVDCGAHVAGFHGDAAISFTIGEPSPEDAELIETTRNALYAGIAQAKVGNRLGDVSHAIGEIGRTRGYGLLAYHGGHGVGRRMHEDPHVPNEGRAGRGLKLKAGLVIAIEPMFIAGGRDNYVTEPDGWGLRSADGSRAAHWEHTIAVTPDGPVILTAP
ncbi:type I methionyl aminopeptidase [Actinocrispum sp. NPDC049592]|uniref:type I methionyl aminopeptidase n=1 Tax=Actinocrispum sp. NPDC049592 TaxID=3154835 RepID=UPI0034257E5B